MKPTRITLNKTEGVLIISWEDGLDCHYPLPHLREACPCAECRGGHANMGIENAPKDILTLTPARSYTVTDLRAIGNYAIQPVWDDGHATGIYSWDYLRYICPERMKD